MHMERLCGGKEKRRNCSPLFSVNALALIKEAGNLSTMWALWSWNSTFLLVLDGTAGEGGGRVGERPVNVSTFC